ncbi:hypothetical protein L829_2382 [Mycobacteroides abscessus MAB_030201_1075]|uniref:N-acetyltransferase domain-containing protein n=1 Tax=Mycobacteroides abscessus MAB_030201_1075 TaxID=1335410 RepID=A0A829PNT8_9MYCO|nr:hypothetical protein L829_2382 [Mycobacteroides abscessus MAB_030201_1075]
MRRVESHRDAKQFIAMPWHIYGDDPRWRPTLRRVMQAKMNSKHNPLHGEVQVENFVAYRGGSPVGRISAAIDSAYVQRYGECAFFGFFESEDDESIAGALLGEAERWAARRGVTKMVGPFSYTSREEVGLLVSGYDRPPALMQPYNPRYYPALVEASGYRKKFDTASYRWHLDGSQDVRQRLVRRADAVMRDQAVTVRSVRMRHYTEELEVLRGLYNDSFAHHPENVPLSREVFSGMAAEMRPLIDPNIVRIVESEGTPVGFLLMLPDVNEIAGRSGRLTRPCWPGWRRAATGASAGSIPPSWCSSARCRPSSGRASAEFWRARSSGRSPAAAIPRSPPPGCMRTMCGRIRLPPR